ncbi:MAG: hypothetical protein A3E82_07115 [Gammaproteobacteria bacterium RIFCSPHIGHO2_12_FULL_38_11]|nr:MAG: hypothetical protein A3E82_07115 [Gammaproteobacteria bacterium RIFCSPHIGHO2_12_FULL_38_11]
MEAKLFERVKKLLAERFAIDPARIHLQTHIQKELNFDSMDALDLLLAVNEEFSIRVPEQALENINTVSDIVDAIASGTARGVHF